MLELLFGAVGAVGENVAERLASALASTAVVRSADGVFVVGGDAVIPSTVRRTMVQYCTATRGRMERATGLDLGLKPGSFEVSLTLNPTNQATVSSSFRLTQSGWVRRLSVRNPDDVDLAEMQAQFCGLVLGGWILDRREGDGQQGTGLPAWLIRGVGRYLEPDRRQRDNEQVLARWSSAELPPIWDLLEGARSPAVQDPAIASMLVAWLLAQPERGTRLEALLLALAGGEPWSPELVQRTVFGGAEQLALDDAWDSWLLSRRRYVAQPGETPTRLVANLRRELLIYPGDFGMPLMLGRGRAFSPALLPVFAGEAWMPTVATRKSAMVRMYAAGRGADLRIVVAAYDRFFDALRRQERAEVIQETLAQAQTLLKELEQKCLTSARALTEAERP